jgi:hypothetical protein
MIYRLFYIAKDLFVQSCISRILEVKKCMNVQQKYALQANCKVYKIRRILITKNM